MPESTWLKISNIEQSINDDTELKQFLANRLQLHSSEIQEIKLLRKSLDARNKNRLKFIYTLALLTPENKKLRRHPLVSLYEPPQPPELKPFLKFERQPIIVGTGPAGLFAALALIEKGYQPLIFERGRAVSERIHQVEQAWQKGIIDDNSNVQFGEGGAGTFSDGKLTARNQDYFAQQVLQRLVKFGAPAEILYQQKPHIGTDRLRMMLPLIRAYLLDNGAQIQYNHRLEKIFIQNCQLTGIQVNGAHIPTRTLILAIGHSARDTYHNLFESGVALESKAFAMGVRVEHPRAFIDQAQYGQNCDFSITGAADYRLTYNWKAGQRGIYSFCMCPGGEIILSASHQGEVVTNGMSYFKRNKPFSNAGIVVTVHPTDFGTGVLDGIEFQQYIEKRAFEVGGMNHFAPAQRLAEFVPRQSATVLPETSYQPGVTPVSIEKIFPPFIALALRQGFLAFERKIPGFIDNGVIIAPETRTSAPLRIVRNPESFESVNVRGLFPIGEGAGYAGGIVSSAADGLKLVWRVAAFNSKSSFKEASNRE